MRDPLRVRGCERLGDLPGNAQQLLHRQRPLAQTGGERLAFHVLHDQVCGAILLADVVQAANVRMIQGGRGASFAFEAVAEVVLLGQLPPHQLDGHGAAQSCIAGTIDFSHSAGAESRLDFVRAQPHAGLQSRHQPSIDS